MQIFLETKTKKALFPSGQGPYRTSEVTPLSLMTLNIKVNPLQTTNKENPPLKSNQTLIHKSNPSYVLRRL